MRSVLNRKREYQLRFNKEKDGCWYVDFPHWPFSPQSWGQPLGIHAGQANYNHSLIMHQIQKEIERMDEQSIFTVRLRPTFDFRQEILSQGCDIEVLEPKWFRDEVAEISKHMWNKYKNDK